MREYTVTLEDIFKGLDSRRVEKKSVVSLSECHNLEPVDDDYVLHEFVIDMDTDDYDWNNAVTPIYEGQDFWLNHGDDIWIDDANDVWMDY